MDVPLYVLGTSVIDAQETYFGMQRMQRMQRR